MSEKNIKYFSEKPPFINRIAEKKYFLEYFNSTPTNILFVYGPKSTGKTTLIKNIIKQDLDNKKFAVSYLNMREVLIKDFSDFKNLFFPENIKGKIKEIVSGIKFNFGFFGWDVDDEKLIKTNIFGVMMEKIKKANEKGIKPVIILDEFQYLKDIILDEKNNLTLIEELFKFFIALTKQNNLAHVVCLTSDSYYMEELYSDTKLANTSDFYLIEHLSKKDIFYWLEDLEKIDKKIVEKIWRNLGGSVWEIWQVLVSYKNTGDYKTKLDDLLQVKYSLIAEYYAEKLKLENKKDFLKIIKNLSKNGEYLIGLEENYSELVKELVDKDIWFYDTKQRKITANSKSFQIAFKKLLKELKKNK